MRKLSPEILHEVLHGKRPHFSTAQRQKGLRRLHGACQADSQLAFDFSQKHGGTSIIEDQA